MKPFFKYALGLAFLLAVVGETSIILSGSKTSSPNADNKVADQTRLANDHPNPADQIKVLSTSASKGGFDNVMILTMKLRNDNAFAVKDFQIVCANYAPSGTELPASFGTLYEKLEPGEAKTFRKINLGLMPPESSSFKCKMAVAQQIGPG